MLLDQHRYFFPDLLRRRALSWHFWMPSEDKEMGMAELRAGGPQGLRGAVGSVMGKASIGPGEISSELGSVGAGVGTATIHGDLKEPSGAKADR